MAHRFALIGIGWCGALLLLGHSPRAQAAGVLGLGICLITLAIAENGGLRK